MAKDKNKIVDMRGRLGATAALDELTQVFSLGDRNLGDASAVLQRGLRSFGAEEMVDELCRRLTRLEPDEDSTALVWALEEIGGPGTIEQMQRIAQTPNLAPRIRTDAAIVLHALGEPIDLETLPAPEPGNIHQILQKILDDTERQLQQVQPEERAFMLDELFDEIGRFMGQGDGPDMLQALVEALGEQDKSVAADMLWVLHEFCLEEDIRNLAERSLEEMRWRDLVPSPSMVAATYNGKLGQAYISDMGQEATQLQLLIAWQQQPDRMILFSFLIDLAYWGGGVKDFFLKPSTQNDEFAEIIEVSKQQGIPMVPIKAADLRRRLGQALQANIHHARPFPLEYRRFHRLITRTLFDGAAPVRLPSLADEAASPLGGKASEVENLLRDSMPTSDFDDEQTLNARMLWRDFYQAHTPRISKVEVWAATVAYIIGWIEGDRERTQQTVAAHYGVSAASVSKRAGEIWELFLDVEQGSIAYATDKVKSGPVEEAMEVMGDFMGKESLLEEPYEYEEELEIDYQDYLEEYAELDAGIRKLSRAEFEQLTDELDFLVALEEVEDMTPEQSKRLREVEHLLLLDLD
jgi:hypothetical protein